MTAATPMDIAAQIRPAMTKLYVTYFRMAEQSDLTGPQLTILTRLAEHGASRISEVARQEGIRMPTASNALHQLEHRGMVERIRDTSDRRGVRVQLTELGRTELKRVGDERTTYLAEMLSSLSPEKLEIAEQIIPVITELAERYSANQKNA
ncbi:MarR family winged helix-turn-helix transcriptional regulator [Corynebacterium pygosceleis]|uniref:MarR family transcriptional regulator n=1 Tax=Corynebacterium pygosceleis TaxID=2800406 RepID=A0A9Q4CAQ4_9CORY|nr:MarR family transcriptional regulator [Corynebacterium pygosceleis]MCK7637159.1 MarR family transcriptional regulator [Corynebacterium pygosceleis]MCK7676095.1 MarR family transcriptional regulator [Corynebacterium pygosceleis]MCL0120066.1 MarR family transcriptional regulator [Corynebacterium pygosceleis]MCX7445062.1 MarR family transcriptional regulator [Corynebacterium pygosceleis]MCX7469426.1 MarR family transcriptional regulator [Corynebacterium pygosceleis]